MKKLLFYIFLAYIALSIQGLIFHGIKPDLALILVCFFSVRHVQGRGMAYGALTGLLIDVSNGFILGPNIFSKTAAAFLAKTISDNLFQWNITISTIMIAALSAVDLFVVYVCYETFLKASFLNRPWGIAAAGISYTIVASLLLYPLFFREKDKNLWISE